MTTLKELSYTVTKKVYGNKKVHELKIQKDA